MTKKTHRTSVTAALAAGVLAAAGAVTIGGDLQSQRPGNAAPNASPSLTPQPAAATDFLAGGVPTPNVPFSSAGAGSAFAPTAFSDGGFTQFSSLFMPSTGGTASGALGLGG